MGRFTNDVRQFEQLGQQEQALRQQIGQGNAPNAAQRDQLNDFKDAKQTILTRIKTAYDAQMERLRKIYADIDAIYANRQNGSFITAAAFLVRATAAVIQETRRRIHHPKRESRILGFVT